jgi:hypothetical protein
MEEELKAAGNKYDGTRHHLRLGAFMWKAFSKNLIRPLSVQDHKDKGSRDMLFRLSFRMEAKTLIRIYVFWRWTRSREATDHMHASAARGHTRVGFLPLSCSIHLVVIPWELVVRNISLSGILLFPWEFLALKNLALKSCSVMSFVIPIL